MSKRARRSRSLALAPAPADAPPRPRPLLAAIKHALLDAISSGELDTELHDLHDAIAGRLHTLHAIQTASALLDLEIGDRVELNDNARPLYLHGAHGTVTGLVDQLVVVALDQPIGRFRSDAEPSRRERSQGM